MKKSERREKPRESWCPETPGKGHLEEEEVDGQQCHRQNVTDDEDRGDRGVSLGSGWWTALAHRGESGFRGRWQWLVVGLRGGGTERLN